MPSNIYISAILRHSKSSDIKLSSSLLYLRRCLKKTLWEVPKLHWRQKNWTAVQYVLFVIVCIWSLLFGQAVHQNHCFGNSYCRDMLLHIKWKDSRVLCELPKWSPAVYMLSSGKSTDGSTSALAAFFW